MSKEYFGFFFRSDDGWFEEEDDLIYNKPLNEPVRSNDYCNETNKELRKD